MGSTHFGADYKSQLDTGWTKHAYGRMPECLASPQYPLFREDGFLRGYTNPTPRYGNNLITTCCDQTCHDPSSQGG